MSCDLKYQDAEAQIRAKKIIGTTVSSRFSALLHGILGRKLKNLLMANLWKSCLQSVENYNNAPPPGLF